MDLKIIKYNPNYLVMWDKFVENGVLGTIYHTRKFINYHPKNRFQDESVLIFKNNILVCILPCCKNGKKYFSHLGCTFGGPVFLEKIFKYNYIEKILDVILKYYNYKLEIRMANNIYFENSIFLLNYLFNRNLKFYPELSWYLNVNDSFLENIKNKNRKRELKKILNTVNCTLGVTETDYINYYKLLEETLKINHNTKPTHSLKEFIDLKNILKNNQMLYIVKKNNNILAGIFTIKVTKSCWYTVYMTRNLKIINSGIYISIILNELIKKANNENIKYIDLGICTENKGKVINKGLTIYKEESLGAISNFRSLYLLN